MGNGLSQDQVNVLIQEGAFNGSSTLFDQKRMSEEQVVELRVRTYDVLLKEVREAANEIQRIQTALSQVEHACRAGKRIRTMREDERINLGNAVVNLDNWIVSLMETNLSITGLLNPSLTRKKITQFGNAMNALMNKRAAEENPVLDDPTLFKRDVNW